MRPDIIGGLSAGAVVIPQAMAYATIAGMPVQVGLYTCLIPMLGYAVLGGSRAMSFSTTSTIAVLAASSLQAAGLPGSADSRAGDLATLTLLVGVILVLARVLRLAGLVENISEALLIGLKTGVGITVAVSQLPKVLGISPPPSDGKFFPNLAHDVSHLNETSVVTLCLGGGTIALLLALKRIAPKVPGALIAVGGGIIASWALHLDHHGVDLIARVPSGLPTPVSPSFHHTGELLPGAIAIALMAFLETVSVARSIRVPGEPPVDNNQELLADGVSTLAGAFFQALPAAGGFSQSAVNRGAGARSQISGVTTVVLAVLTALFLGPVLSELPQATLGALVIVATLGLISVREMIALAHFDRLELVVALVTAVFGLVVGLLPAVVVGVGLTLILVLHELNKVPMFVLGVRADGVVAPDAPPVDGLLILRVGAPLYTANVRTASDHIVAGVDAAGRHVDVVLVDATAIGALSMTILSDVRETQRRLAERGVTLWLSSIPERSLAMAQRAPGWADWTTSGRVWPTVADGVVAYRSRIERPASGAAAPDVRMES